MADYMLDPFGQPSLDTHSIHRGGADRMAEQHKPVSRIQQAVNSVLGLVGGLDQTKMAIVFDFSHWNGVLNFTQMQAHGFWTKICDGAQMYPGDYYDPQNYIDKTARVNIQGAYDAKKPCGIYMYVQLNIVDYTLKSIIDWHIKVFKAATKGLIAGKSYHAIALDVEERDSTSTNASAVVQGIYNAIRSDPEYAAVDIYIYTSISILDLYPALRDWLSYQGADKNLWMAQWAYVKKPTTWTDLVNNIIATLNIRVLTPGYATWRMLQFGTFSGLAGIPGEADANLFKGTVLDYTTAMKYLPPVVPVPDGTAPGQPGAIVYGYLKPNLTLTWAPATDNIGVTSYRVKRNGALLASPSTNTYMDTSTVPGESYTYDIAAIDAAGNIGPSITTAILIPLDTVPTDGISRAEFDAHKADRAAHTHTHTVQGPR